MIFPTITAPVPMNTLLPILVSVHPAYRLRIYFLSLRLEVCGSPFQSSHYNEPCSQSLCAKTLSIYRYPLLPIQHSHRVSNLQIQKTLQEKSVPPPANFIDGMCNFPENSHLFTPCFLYNPQNAPFTFSLNCVDRKFSSTLFFPAAPYVSLSSAFSANVFIASAYFLALRFSTSIPSSPFMQT